MEFELNGKEFIQLNKLLKILALVESGGRANTVITEGLVSLNGEVETAKRKKIRPGDKLVFQDCEITVK